jgi:hypothetical protein
MDIKENHFYLITKCRLFAIMNDIMLVILNGGCLLFAAAAPSMSMCAPKPSPTPSPSPVVPSPSPIVPSPSPEVPSPSPEVPSPSPSPSPSPVSAYIQQHHCFSRPQYTAFLACPNLTLCWHLHDVVKHNVASCPLVCCPVCCIYEARTAAGYFGIYKPCTSIGN